MYEFIESEEMASMLDKKFEVIKDIPEGWEVGARSGEILTVEKWGGIGCSDWTLMKDGKAVCDLSSSYGKEHCVEIV